MTGALASVGMTLAAVPFDLTEVKLSPPVARPGIVPKVDVIARLRAESGPLVTVVAPAGYGKTTLLAKWAEADPRPFAWVALDGRDDDVMVFLRYIAAAVHRLEPISDDVFDALSGPGGSTWWTRVRPVGCALRALGRPFVLVLDDLHAIANPSCLDALAELVEYVPTGSQLAIASREQPPLPLPLPSWRAKRLVREIGVADLRLDAREAGLLLEAAGVRLDAGEVAELTDHTEGWPAGLYLAALSIHAGAPSTASVAGDDRFVADYFRLELLSRLRPSEAEFLKQTSVLERMSGDLCDAVLDTTGSARTLEKLKHANGFVVPLDRRGEWYRYHHLFGELLRDELERGAPELAHTLNARAMAWCTAHDLPEEAVVYGHEAGATDAVAGLIDALALPLHYDGRRETVEEWLAWFSDDELLRYPALSVAGAWFRVLTGRPDDAERWLALADGATSTIPLSDGSATIEPWVATLRASMMRDGVEQALADAERALDGYAPHSLWRPAALVIRGTMRALLGANDSAADDFTNAATIGAATGAAEVVYIAHAQLALLAAGRGAWTIAGKHARAAQQLVEDAGLGDYSSSAIAHVVAARIALHQRRPDDARAALARAHRVRPMLDHGIPWLTIQVGLELTGSHLALGDTKAARTILTETERVLALRPQMGFLVDDARQLREQVDATSGSAGAWAMSLTAAELRLLPYLATHLKFPEIADRLFISRNTAKTEAIAIYRKLGVSSRSEAVERAVEVGLLGSSVFPPGVNLMPTA
jgi:LuxR family transcriptional regulator, maltose regulon positive regulatory protein